MREVKELRFDCAIGRWSLQLLAPAADLAAFVEVFWEVRGFANFARERILPKENIELMFNLGPPHRLLDPGRPASATVYRDAWVSGLQQRPLVIEPCFDARRVPSHLLAVRLRPVGAYAFFGMPMDEVSNQVIDLDALLGRRVACAADGLREQRTVEHRFAFLERLVRRRIAAGPDVRAFVRWSALAQSCGYYDQAHLNHDCQSFAGMAPTNLLRTLSPDGVAAVEFSD